MAAFLGFVLLAVQIVVGLYATSTVTAVGLDAARRVASAEVDHTDPVAVAAARRRAENRARQALGRFGDDVSFDWTASDDDVVRLHLQASVPRTGLGRVVAGPLGLATIDRTVDVRVERLR